VSFKFARFFKRTGSYESFVPEPNKSVSVIQSESLSYEYFLTIKN